MRRPNVLLVVLDTARADALEPYGAATGASPTVAQLASRGKAHRAVHATANWTVPSHASMFTGLLPRRLGLTQIPGERPHGARPILEKHRDRLLAEVLRRNGYRTGAVSTNLWLTEETGFELGFERFRTISPNRQLRLASPRARSRVKWAANAVLARVDDGAADAAAVLREWAAEPSDRPFFWFVNLVECHSPYLPPKPYNDLGPLQRLRAAEEARKYLTLDAIWRACAGRLGFEEEALARMRRLYAGAVRYMDDWLAGVLQALDDAGRLDDTLVLVTSDHGENFGENGLVVHAFSLDDRLVRVPLVTAGPVELPLEEPGSLMGLPRALARALDIDDHPWQERTPLPVAQADPPAPRSDPRVDRAIAEWGLGEEAAWRISTQITAVADGRFKLVRQGDVEQLHDLSLDPLEAAPLDTVPAGEEARVAALRTALQDPAVWAAPDGAPSPAPAADPEEVEALERQMRLLGYL
ncbi:MAG TPA: sulfatase-like hydrolase/transferase [Solirubrobacteraceae bacterium]|jgi:arylsulfatase A-like enzyme